MRLRAMLATLLVAALTVPIAISATADSAVACAPPEESMVFTQDYIDTTRAGGEPILETLVNGQEDVMLWGSHAGTTHFYTPAVTSGDVPTSSAPFVQNYEGQTYQYFSTDDGATWEFSPRTPVQAGADSGVQNSGFSDPVFAEDLAGNVYISEINLANVAVSKSTDQGRTWTLQNFFGLTGSDRQWMAADEEDVVYMTANTFAGGSLGDTPPGVTGSTANRIYKSVDGDITWSRGHTTGGSSSSDIKVDWNTGAVYQPQRSGGLAVWPEARDEDFAIAPTLERHVIFDGYRQQSSIGPSIELDDEGNIYAVWDQDAGNPDYPAGIYFSAASTDDLDSWSEPVRVDVGPEHSFWPWIEVGEQGAVGIAWLENSEVIPSENAEDAGADSEWYVMAAQTFDGDASFNDDKACDIASFNVVQASTTPVHHGTVCTGGTVCQARAVDRRLGDYFGNEISPGGRMVIAVSDTRQGGSVALPLGIRQIAGPSFANPGEMVDAQ